MPIRKFPAGRRCFFSSPMLHHEDKAWDTFKRNNVAVVNVSDLPGLAYQDTKIPYVYIPVVERAPWGYASFFAALLAIKRLALKPTSNVMFYYRAGITRSQMVAVTMQLVFGGTPATEKLARWNKLVAKERIPANIVQFLKYACEHPNLSIQNILNRLPQESLQ